jgi:ketosteroid isomerase-like protein
MNEARHERIARQVLSAWNSHDVDRVIACYTPNVIYRDPNTEGEIRGSEAFRRYLDKLFGAWRMHWTAKEIFSLTGTEGSAVLWRATLAPVGGQAQVEIDGMDIALLDGERLSRNEVYFDRAALASLLSPRRVA